MPPGPASRKCTAYLLAGPGGMPLALRLSEGLGRILAEDRFDCFKHMPAPAWKIWVDTKFCSYMLLGKDHDLRSHECKRIIQARPFLPPATLAGFSCVPAHINLAQNMLALEAQNQAFDVLQQEPSFFTRQDSSRPGRKEWRGFGLPLTEVELLEARRTNNFDRTYAAQDMNLAKDSVIAVGRLASDARCLVDFNNRDEKRRGCQYAA